MNIDLDIVRSYLLHLFSTRCPVSITYSSSYQYLYHTTYEYHSVGRVSETRTFRKFHASSTWHEARLIENPKLPLCSQFQSLFE